MSDKVVRRISSSLFQRKYGEVLHLVMLNKFVYFITSNNRALAVLIAPDRYDELLEKEKKADKYTIHEYTSVDLTEHLQ